MSSLLEFPIRRYQFTMVAFLCLVALGWYAFASVPREEDPYFKIPGFTIAAIYPGADPKDLERLIAKPLEDKFAALDDVLKMETSIRDGVSFTAIEFQAFTDADKKYDEITRELNALRPDFPEGTQIIVRKFSPGLVNTVQIALVSEDAPYRELEDHARAGAGGLSLKLIKLGGMTNAVAAGKLCRKLGLKINVAAKIAESSIGTSAAVALACAVPNVAWGVSLTNLYLAEDIVKTPIAVRDGTVALPQAPGLGVTVDEAAVERFRVNALS